MKSMRCLTHECDVVRVTTSSKTWGWVEKRKCYRYNYRKTTKLVCTRKRKPAANSPPDVSQEAGEFELRLGGEKS